MNVYRLYGYMFFVYIRAAAPRFDPGFRPKPSNGVWSERFPGKVVSFLININDERPTHTRASTC